MLRNDECYTILVTHFNLKFLLIYFYVYYKNVKNNEKGENNAHVHENGEITGLKKSFT